MRMKIINQNIKVLVLRVKVHHTNFLFKIFLRFFFYIFLKNYSYLDIFSDLFKIFIYFCHMNEILFN